MSNTRIARLREGMLETTQTEQTDTAPDSPRYVVGRYRVHVEALLPDGLAHGRIIEIIEPPDEAAYATVYGAGRAVETPTEFTFIGALPGETVEVEVRWNLPRPGRKRAKRVPAPQAHVIAVATPAPDRATPGCPVFGECGGCQLQHMDYAAQLAWKRERVLAALRDAGFGEPPVMPAIGCESPWGYRNHMRFSVNWEGRPRPHRAWEPSGAAAHRLPTRASAHQRRAGPPGRGSLARPQA